MVHHRWLVARFHRENCRRDNLASTPLAMNQSIFFVSAPIFLAFVLGLGFLFLCSSTGFAKKRISLGFNFVAALIVAWFGLP
jgi:hypothetical protein